LEQKIYIATCSTQVQPPASLHTPVHTASAPSPPTASRNHVKIFKGWPLRDAPSKLVQLWHKTFPTDHDGLVEMKNPTRLSNKTSTPLSFSDHQILENKISGTAF